MIKRLFASDYRVLNYIQNIQFYYIINIYDNILYIYL